MSKLSHALDAASRGLPVFPQTGKRPAIRNWPENASLKESVIRRWWGRWPDHDIGIALPADIYVLDADTPEALATLDTLGLPRTLEIATARGCHIYLRVPHELARMAGGGEGLRSLEGKGAPGPVTWAGSVHPSGHVYTIVVDAPIATMPGALVQVIGVKQPRSNTGEATPDERAAWGSRAALMSNAAIMICGDAEADLRHELRALRSELPAMPTGWADRLFRAGAQLGPYVASGALGLDHTIKELTDLFTELDKEQRNPEHALRSIERGVATGARDAVSL